MYLPFIIPRRTWHSSPAVPSRREASQAAPARGEANPAPRFGHANGARQGSPGQARPGFGHANGVQHGSPGQARCGRRPGFRPRGGKRPEGAAAIPDAQGGSGPIASAPSGRIGFGAQTQGSARSSRSPGLPCCTPSVCEAARWCEGGARWVCEAARWCEGCTRSMCGGAGWCEGCTPSVCAGFRWGEGGRGMGLLPISTGRLAATNL